MTDIDVLAGSLELRRKFSPGGIGRSGNSFTRRKQSK
jgi:hypothetical protein